MSFTIITEETACMGFNAGFDCSQEVFAHIAVKLGMKETEALRIAAAFGGGMWHGETCGCVTGGLMAIGLKYGHYEENDAKTKSMFLQKKQEFESRFCEMNGSLICREILGNDLSKPEEMKIIMEKELLATLCPKLVCVTCKILDEMI